jgi:hypothetical protein
VACTFIPIEKEIPFDPLTSLLLGCVVVPIAISLHGRRLQTLSISMTIDPHSLANLDPVVSVVVSWLPENSKTHLLQK